MLAEHAEPLPAPSEQGLVARLAYLELQLIEHEQDLVAQRHRLTEVIATTTALREQRRQAVSEFRRGVLGQLAASSSSSPCTPSAAW